jgi:sec-independent protein translocase protein TatA
MNLPCVIPSSSCLALIGDVGGMELLVILGAILILFGGKGLPGIARSLGKITRDLQRTSEDFKKQLLTADQVSEDGDRKAEIKDIKSEPHDTAG